VIHARDVCIEQLALLRVELAFIGCRRRPNAECAQKAIRIDHRLAQHLGQTPLADTTKQLHLPQALLRVQVALREQHVFRVLSPDVRNARRIMPYFDFARDVCRAHIGGVVGFCALDKPDAGCHGDKCEGNER
jgi:hypothetical protein